MSCWATGTAKTRRPTGGVGETRALGPDRTQSVRACWATYIHKQIGRGPRLGAEAQVVWHLIYAPLTMPRTRQFRLLALRATVRKLARTSSLAHVLARSKRSSRSVPVDGVMDTVGSRAPSDRCVAIGGFA